MYGATIGGRGYGQLDSSSGAILPQATVFGTLNIDGRVYP